MRVPFNRPDASEREFANIRQAHVQSHLSGDGPFTRECQRWLERQIGAERALLTHSATAALEICAILTDIRPGDEIIMPSFTFVATATAFVLRGGVPVFVDIRPDTQNIDEARIEAAITDRTKAIVVVHYAGIAAEMDAICAIAKRHGLMVVEDASQAAMSSYKGRPLGSIGDLAAISFHETKVLHCGEGGALLVNRGDLVERARTLWDKGTNRGTFFRGEVDKYTWVDLGSSFQASELNAAFLKAQFDQAYAILADRMKVWDAYHQAIEPLEARGNLRRPVAPPECQHNAHLYYMLLRTREARDQFIDALRRHGVTSVFHYVPLHDSPAGLRYGRSDGLMAATRIAGECLVRLPLWRGMTREVDHVIDAVVTVMESL
jgi:dTDP-4-amino-4,6-dideoxygalactose transaminase